MKLIIDISNYDVEWINNGRCIPNEINYKLADAIYYGTSLPEGHGRLIDADELLKAIDTWDKFGFEHTGCFVRNPGDDFTKYVHYDDMVKSIRGAETIIEADRAENEETK